MVIFMITVIIPAAGQGKRMNVAKNKIFLELDSRPILLRTIEQFVSCQQIQEIIIAASDADIPFIQQMLLDYSFSVPCKVVKGGSERQYSVYNALQYVSDNTDIVLIHDAARPLVRTGIIRQIISTAQSFGAAIAAVPSKNTVKIVEHGLVINTPLRETVWEIHTPQAFRRPILLDAYNHAMEVGFLGTDDASLLEKIGYPVHVVKDEYSNIKVTTPEDLPLAEALLHISGGQDD